MVLSLRKRRRIWRLLEALLPSFSSEQNINVAGLTLEMIKTVDIVDSVLRNPVKAAEQLEKEQLLSIRQQLAQQQGQAPLPHAQEALAPVTSPAVSGVEVVPEENP